MNDGIQELLDELSMRYSPEPRSSESEEEPVQESPMEDNYKPNLAIPTIPYILSKMEVSRIGDYDRERLAMAWETALQDRAIQHQEPCWSFSGGKNMDNLKPGLSVEDIVLNLSNKFNLKKLYWDQQDGIRKIYFFNDRSLLKFDIYKYDRSFRYEFSTQSKDEFESFKKESGTWSSNKEVKGQIFLFQSDGGEIRLKDVGIGGKPLVRENYTPEVLEDYDYIVKNLPEKDASRGRLAVITGIPGGGKSFLVRGMVEEAENCVFALLNAEQINYLISPSYITPLVNFKNKYKDRSVVFIIEDGDNVIAERENGNMSLLSTLLNCADGLLGSALFNYKFIVTTNSKVEPDHAVVRAGRLLRHVKVDPIPYKQSLEIIKRLSEGKIDSLENKAHTIADLYALARDSETGFEPPKPKKMGFGA